MRVGPAVPCWTLVCSRMMVPVADHHALAVGPEPDLGVEPGPGVADRPLRCPLDDSCAPGARRCHPAPRGGRSSSRRRSARREDHGERPDHGARTDLHVGCHDGSGVDGDVVAHGLVLRDGGAVGSWPAGYHRAPNARQSDEPRQHPHHRRPDGAGGRGPRARGAAIRDARPGAEGGPAGGALQGAHGGRARRCREQRDDGARGGAAGARAGARRRGGDEPVHLRGDAERRAGGRDDGSVRRHRPRRLQPRPGRSRGRRSRLARGW